MVDYQMLSVGLLVEPESLWKQTSKSRRAKSGNDQGESSAGEEDNLTIGFEYRPDIRDFIIQVADMDTATGKIKEIQQEALKNLQEPRKLKRVDTLETDSGVGESEETNYRNEMRMNNSRGENTSESQHKHSRPRHSITRNSRNQEELPNARNRGKASAVSLNCDYYRQKFLQEGLLEVQQSNEYAEWLKFDAQNMSPGQKVVNKISAQQKALEAEMAKQKKKGSGGSRSGSDSSQHSNMIPPRRKTHKVEPLPVHVRICLDDSPPVLKVM